MRQCKESNEQAQLWTSRSLWSKLTRRASTRPVAVATTGCTDIACGHNPLNRSPQLKLTSGAQIWPIAAQERRKTEAGRLRIGLLFHKTKRANWKWQGFLVSGFCGACHQKQPRPRLFPTDLAKNLEFRPLNQVVQRSVQDCKFGIVFCKICLEKEIWFNQVAEWQNLLLRFWIHIQRKRYPFSKSKTFSCSFLQIPVFVLYFLFLNTGLVKTLLKLQKVHFWATSNILLCKFWVWGAWIRHWGWIISPFSKSNLYC